MQTRDDLYDQLKEYLRELFEIAPEQVRPESRLVEDLDLDSIDAVDLIVKLQEVTGRKIPPEAFKSVRTIDDVVDCVYALLAR